MFFKHYKGKYYQKIAEVLDVHTENIMILYCTLYDTSPRLFVREKENFEDDVFLNNTVKKRFAPVEMKDIPEEYLSFILHKYALSSFFNIPE